MEEADRLAGRIAIIDDGKIVAEGTPAQLKSRVGDPTLTITLEDPAEKVQAEAVLLPFGEPAPEDGDVVAVRLAGGASNVAAVVRALDEARVRVAALELHMPSLDDVFQIATGRRLEGAEQEGERIQQ
jgi:ABC-2 type transport system ATP-binding protein